MKSFLFLLFVAFCGAAEKRQANLPQGLFTSKETCLADEEVYRAFHLAYDGFVVKLYQTLAARETKSYTTSPQTVWITLAAIAEGSDYFTQKELFAVLNLPKELCSRQKFYEIATTRIPIPKYITSTRAIVIDEAARVNPHWYGLITQSGLLDVIPAPLRFDRAATTEIVSKLINPKVQQIDFTGNSILVNSLDYNGLWTNAFSDAVIQRAGFYNKAGEKIGSVDLMRMIRPARIGVVKSLNMKVLELPVGANKEYSFIFALTSENDVNPTLRSLSNTIVLEILESLHDSPVPIDIAIPRLTINTELDMKDVLRDMGVLSTVWNTQGATRFISTPAARPNTFIERTSVTLNNQGLVKPTFDYPVYRHASKEELYWSDFIADRPFMFGLFDTETYTNLLAAMYSQPTYPLNEVVPTVAQQSIPEVSEAVEVSTASETSQPVSV